MAIMAFTCMVVIMKNDISSQVTFLQEIIISAYTSGNLMA